MSKEVAGFDFNKMIDGLSAHVDLVKKYLDALGKSTTGDVNLGQMFKLQFHMQVMSQFIEATSNSLTAVHNEMLAMAKAVKGQ